MRRQRPTKKRALLASPAVAARKPKIKPSVMPMRPAGCRIICWMALIIFSVSLLSAQVDNAFFCSVQVGNSLYISIQKYHEEGMTVHRIKAQYILLHRKWVNLRTTYKFHNIAANMCYYSQAHSVYLNYKTPLRSPHHFQSF